MADTATKDTPGRHEGSPAPEYITRKVGTLDCRFVALRAAPQSPNPIPTVESIAQIAYRMLPANADVWPNMAEGREAYRKGMLATKPTREAAKAAVRTEHLRRPSGDVYAAGELAPLVTAVRKQLAADLRRTFREQDRRDRADRARESRDDAARQRIKAKAAEKAMRGVTFAQLPEGARPTKATSSDKTRPVLQGAVVYRIGRGEKARWFLGVTDSYQCVRFPLAVQGDHLKDGLVIGAEALKAIEAAGAFRVTKQGLIQPVSVSSDSLYLREEGLKHGGSPIIVPITRAHDVGESFGPVGQKFPNLELFWTKPAPPTKRIEVTFNAGLLDQLADTMKGSGGIVTLVIDDRQLQRGDDGVRRPKYTSGPAQAFGVLPRPTDRGTEGILMPVRHDKT